MKALRASFVDEELTDHHTDLLFSVEVCGRQTWVYILLEHQSTNDREMPRRMYGYIKEIWQRFRDGDAGSLPPVIPIVLTHVPGGWTAPRSLHETMDPNPSTVPGMARFVPGFELIIEDLAVMTNEDIKAKALSAFPKLVLWALRDARTPVAALANLGTWLDAFAEALRTPSGIKAVAQLLAYLSLVLDDAPYYEICATIVKVAPSSKESIMTAAEKFIQQGRSEGRAEGRSEGRAEGRSEGRIEMLTKLVIARFGAISEAQQSRLDKATDDELNWFVERVLIAESIDALLGE